MSSNQISGFGINVADLDRSTEFYTRGLGLQEKGKYDLGHMHEVLSAPTATPVSIFLIKYTGAHRGTRHRHRVREDRARVRRRRRGLRAGDGRGWHVATGAPHHRTMGLTVAMVRDPDGYLIELVKQTS